MHFRRMIPFLSFIFIFISSTVLLSGARIVEFHARRENNAVILKWATEEETNLLKFVIQRSTDTVNWTTIGEKSAFGESSSKRDYSFIDNSIFKNNISNFYYRLVIVEKNGQSTPHDVIVSITGGSGIKHTWGSIKALFR